MATANMLAFLLMFVGALVLVWGRRTSILTACIGSLFGVGILSLLHGQQNGIFALLVVFGLATAGSIAGLFIKSLGKLLVDYLHPNAYFLPVSYQAKLSDLTDQICWKF